MSSPSFEETGEGWGENRLKNTSMFIFLQIICNFLVLVSRLSRAAHVDDTESVI